MKNIQISFLLLFISACVYPQFSNDLGNSSNVDEGKKKILKGVHFCTPPPLWNKWKFDNSDRRFRFRAHMYDNCSYNPESLNSTNGWNKIGRINFTDNPYHHNRFKMHLGWIFRDDPSTVRYSLYYHNDEDEELFVAHRIDEMSFNPDASPLVDMYLGRWVIGMIISNWYSSNDETKCLGIREDNSGLSVLKDSWISKTFYFGGDSEAPHKMEMRFHDLWVDETGYQTKFNSNDIMTWNLSEFTSGDDFSYTAGKEIHGSIADPGRVQYRSNDPNKEHQKCIIKPGASIQFTAGESVHLHPGFHAEQGSYFRAVPEPVTKINILNGPKEIYDQITFEVENAKLAELSLYTDQGQEIFVCGKQILMEPSSKMASTSIDTILTENMYYLVAYFYSGEGSQKRWEGWVDNSNKSMKGTAKASANIDLLGSRADESSKSCIIYPNPNPGIFNIEFQEEDVSTFTVEVLNTLGNTVFYKQNIPTGTMQINLASQAIGLYFVKVYAGDQVYTEKVVYR
jgi:hypothetical protein